MKQDTQTTIVDNVSHFQQVDIDNIGIFFSDSSNRPRNRYRLSIPFLPDPKGNRTKTVAVVVRNSISMDKHRIDKMIRTVEKYVHRHFSDVAKIEIIIPHAIRAISIKDVQNVLRVVDYKRQVADETVCALKEITERYSGEVFDTILSDADCCIVGGFGNYGLSSIHENVI